MYQGVRLTKYATVCLTKYATMCKRCAFYLAAQGETRKSDTVMWRTAVEALHQAKNDPKVAKASRIPKLTTPRASSVVCNFCDLTFELTSELDAHINRAHQRELRSQVISNVVSNIV